jgi:hypothetical protein
MIGEFLGNTIYGFAATSVFFIIVLLILIYFRKKIIVKPILDTVIKELNKKTEDEEE